MTMKPISFESTVPEHLKVVALDKYLADRFAYRSIDQWRQEISDGKLVVNNVMVSQVKDVFKGDLVVWNTQLDEPAVNDKIDLIYEDDEIVVVNKPAPLPCHAKAPYFRNTLIYLMRERRSEPSLSLVHRLDAGTSGVLVLARNKDSQKILMSQFENRQVSKNYLALCQGAPEWEIKTLNAPLKQIELEGLRRWEVSSEGKESLTDFKRVEQVGDHCLVRARPKTGRTHQIRAHLAYLGHAIVGDPIYAADDETVRRHRLFLTSDGKEGKRGDFGSPRLMLHAHTLQLRHPKTNKQHFFEAAVPPEFKGDIQ